MGKEAPLLNSTPILIQRFVQNHPEKKNPSCLGGSWESKKAGGVGKEKDSRGSRERAGGRRGGT